MIKPSTPTWKNRVPLRGKTKYPPTWKNQVGVRILFILYIKYVYLKKYMKEKEFKFFILNLPIVGNKSDNVELYSNFFEYIFSRKKAIELSKDKAAIIRTMNKSDDGKYKIYWGYITSFTKVGSTWLNLYKMDKEEFQIPQNLFANPRESYYFYLPKFHRIVIMKSGDGISLGNAEKYFLKLQNEINKKYDFNVHHEISSDALEIIYKADVVKSIVIDFSYSNADIGDEAFDFVDEEMKNSNINSLKITARSNTPEGIDISESKIISGSMELSKSYGNAQAVIVNAGKRRTIKTQDYPFIMSVHANIADFGAFYHKVYDKLKQYLGKK